MSRAGDWLNSPVLDRIVTRVGRHYRLGRDDVSDLAQETRIALWGVGVETLIKVEYVERVAANKAVDLLRKLVCRRAMERAAARESRNLYRDEEPMHLLNVAAAGLQGRVHEFYDLHYREGLSEREIARAWGVCRASVRWLDRGCRESVLRQTPTPPQAEPDRSAAPTRRVRF